MVAVVRFCLVGEQAGLQPQDPRVSSAYLQAFRGFAGTSILILVGVATDTARRVKAEQAMQRYKDYDRLYDEM